MSEIRIDYTEVYSKVRELQNRLNSELRDMNAAYRQITSSLMGMDSRTNAELMETCTLSQEKSHATVGTLQQLLIFIESSARAMEQEEAEISRVFGASAISRNSAERGNL